MALTWIQALKKWNSTNTCWCVPRKGTEQYNEVMALMKEDTPKKKVKIPEEEKKTKKKKQSNENVKTIEKKIVKEEIKEGKQDTSNNYLERISLKYSVPIKRVNEADEYVRKHFIDSGFAKYYRAAHSDPISMITKASTKTNPHSDRKFINEGIAKTNSSIEEAKRIVKPYEPHFFKTMLNPVLCEIFCNIVVDTHLTDIIYINEKFKHTFALVYGKDMVYVDSQSDREKVKALVKSDSNAEYIKQQAAKNTR